MRSKDIPTDDDLAQQRAEAGDQQTADDRRYAALFSTLNEMRAPEPGSSMNARVVANVRAERQRRGREKRSVRGLVVALFGLVVGYGGAALVRAPDLLGETPGLLLFSAAIVTVVGVLSGWLSGRRMAEERLM